MAKTPEISFFMSLRTGEVLPAPDPGRHGYEWAARNAARLGIAVPKGYRPNDLDAEKPLARALAEAGWCHARAFSNYRDRPGLQIGPVPLAGLADAVRRAMAQGTGEPEHVSAVTTDAGWVQLDPDHVRQLLEEGTVAPAALSPHRESNAKLNEVLDALRALPYADRITVFGSVARGKAYPTDIDVWVDLRGSDGSEDLSPLLRLARRHYGLFDPFVETGDGVDVRSETARSWVAARGARAIKASVLAEGRPLSEIPALVTEAGEDLDAARSPAP